MRHEGVGWAEGALEKLVDLFEGVLVINDLVEEVWSGADWVGLLLETKCCSGKQDEEADMRQRVSDELGGWTFQCIANLQSNKVSYSHNNDNGKDC